MTLTKAIIGLSVAGILGLFWTDQRQSPGSKSTRVGYALRDVEEGESVCLSQAPGWVPTDATEILLISVSATCEICKAERDFHAALAADSEKMGIPAYFVVPPGAGQDKLAEELRSGGKRVLRIDSEHFGTVRTPTILLASPQGVVISRWIGAASADVRDTLLTRMAKGESFQKFVRITRAELPGPEAGPQILALSKPNKSTLPVKIIPIGELFRARYELSIDKPLFIDCSTASALMCQEAALQLSSEFAQVTTIDLSQRPPCD